MCGLPRYSKSKALLTEPCGTASHIQRRRTRRYMAQESQKTDWGARQSTGRTAGDPRRVPE